MNYEEKSGNPLIRKQILIPREQAQMIRGLAFFQKKTESEIIRQALSEFFDKDKSTKILLEKKIIIDEILKKM